MLDINNKLTIEELFNVQHERLRLKWVAGKEGQANIIMREVSLPKTNKNDEDTNDCENQKKEHVSQDT